MKRLRRIPNEKVKTKQRFKDVFSVVKNLLQIEGNSVVKNLLQIEGNHKTDD